MKRFACLLLIVLVCFTPCSVAKAQQPSYALIGENAALYADEACSLPICSLAQNYFVTVMQEGESALWVGYCDLVGYVPLSSVTKVDYTPKSVYPSLACVPVANDGNAVTLRSAPFHEEKNELERLQSGTEVTYYGKVTGSAQVPQVGNEWYYVKIGQTRGYVYSLYLTPPDFAPNDTSPLELPTPSLSTEGSLGEKGKTALVVLLCLSALLTAWFLLKNGKKEQKA